VRPQNCENRLLASSYLSVCPHGTTGLPLRGFSRNFMFELLFFFENLSRIQVFDIDILISIYLSTAVGLTPGVSTHLHIKNT
jgi:hypothetical protein